MKKPEKEELLLRGEETRRIILKSRRSRVDQNSFFVRANRAPERLPAAAAQDACTSAPRVQCALSLPLGSRNGSRVSPSGRTVLLITEIGWLRGQTPAAAAEPSGRADRAPTRGVFSALLCTRSRSY